MVDLETRLFQAGAILSVLVARELMLTNPFASVLLLGGYLSLAVLMLVMLQEEGPQGKKEGERDEEESFSVLA